MYNVVAAPGLTWLLTHLNWNTACGWKQNSRVFLACQTAHFRNFCISPSKSTVPSPLLSASLTTASISFLLAFSPSSLTMACLSSSDVMEPSPSMSNCRRWEEDGAVRIQSQRLAKIGTFWSAMRGLPTVSTVRCQRSYVRIGARGSPLGKRLLAPSSQSCRQFRPEAWETSVRQNPQSPLAPQLFTGEMVEFKV